MYLSVRERPSGYLSNLTALSTCWRHDWGFFVFVHAPSLSHLSVLQLTYPLPSNLFKFSQNTCSAKCEQRCFHYVCSLMPWMIWAWGRQSEIARWRQTVLSLLVYLNYTVLQRAWILNFNLQLHRKCILIQKICWEGEVAIALAAPADNKPQLYLL